MRWAGVLHDALNIGLVQAGASRDRDLFSQPVASSLAVVFRMPLALISSPRPSAQRTG